MIGGTALILMQQIDMHIIVLRVCSLFIITPLEIILVYMHKYYSFLSLTSNGPPIYEISMLYHDDLIFIIIHHDI